MGARRFLAGGVAVAASAVLIAACGGSKGSSGGTAAQGKPVTLTVWDFGYFPDLNRPGLEKIDQQFQRENPNVTIKHVGIPYANAFERYRAAIAARKGPDLIAIYPGAFAADYRDGLLPLDDKLTAEQKKDLLLLDVSKAPDGKTYALPWTVYGFVFYYDKKQFAKAGISAPPQSWNDLLAACSKLSAGGVAPIASGWKDGFMAEWFYYVFADQLISPDELNQLVAAKLPLDSPKLIRALDFLRQLQQAKCFGDGGAGRTSTDAKEEFTGGKAAMLLEVDSELKAYRKAMGAGNLGVFEPPVVPGSRYPKMMDVGPNHGYGITKFSPNPDAAFKYLSYLVSAAGQKIQYDTRGSLPSTKGVALNSADKDEQAIIDWVSRPTNHTVYLSLPQSVTAILDHRASALVAGQTSGADVGKEMEQTMQRVRPKLGAAR